jgi:hypothetical protein
VNKKIDTTEDANTREVDPSFLALTFEAIVPP